MTFGAPKSLHNPHQTIQERAQFALDHPDIQHSPADLREIIAGLLTERDDLIEAGRELLASGGQIRTFVLQRSPIPEGFGVFALIAPGVYCLQSVTYLHREDADRAATRFIPGSDAHVRPLFAGGRL